MPRYTLLTPGYLDSRGSGNIGDRLLSQQSKAIISQITGGGAEFVEHVYLDDLSNCLDAVNSTDAVLDNVFTFWKGLREENPLFRYIDRITVPVIPLTVNTIMFPGHPSAVASYRMASEDVDCIKRMMRGLDLVPCREHLTEVVLHNHGITNTTMVGDFGWYDLDKIGVAMHAPKEIRKIAFTPGHYLKLYEKQICAVMRYLRRKFPDAEIAFFAHRSKFPNRRILTLAQSLGFDIAPLGHYDTSVFEQYEHYDLHVGYRVHGYIGFLRKRRPAILIAEDNRGFGFGYTLGNAGVFPGQTRSSLFRTMLGKGDYCPDMGIVQKIDRFIDEQLYTAFSAYYSIPSIIDSTYRNRMVPYLRKVLNL